MRKGLEEKLVAEFPTVFAGYHGNPRETAMCWGFDFGDGWFDLVRNLTRELYDLEPHFVVDQAKQKYGGLRYYCYFEKCDCGNVGVDPWKIIEKYETLSYKTCEICGKAGTIREDLGWVMTLCSEHYKGKKEEPFKKLRERRAKRKKEQSS